MNIRKIVTYNALRKQFTPEELIFADTLYNASESERELLITALQPEKVVAKRAGKKGGSKGASKSARASSIQQQLKGTALRTVTGAACSVCGNVEDHPDHDTAHYLSAHEFNTGKPAAEIMTHEASAGR